MAPFRTCAASRRAFFPALAVLAVAALAARAQDDLFSDRLEEIRRLEDDGARAAACRDLLRAGPPEAVGAACRCLLFLAEDLPDSAKGEADRFLAAGAYVAPGALLLVDELDRRGRAILALHLLGRAVEAAPSEALLQARLGSMALVRGDTVRADRCAEATARLRGDFVALARGMVRTYARWERSHDAVLLLYRLAPRAESAEEYAAIQRELGFAALGLGDTTQARISLRESVAWAPARETRDALLFLDRLKSLPEDEARRRGRARAEEALGWTLAPSPLTLLRLESMRQAGESCLPRGQDVTWRRPE